MSRSRQPRRSADIRRRRERAVHATDERQVEPLLGGLHDEPGCSDHCSMCHPDWSEREAIRRRMLVESPPFTVAERVLAQAGIRIVLLV